MGLCHHITLISQPETKWLLLPLHNNQYFARNDKFPYPNLTTFKHQDYLHIVSIRNKTTQKSYPTKGATQPSNANLELDSTIKPLGQMRLPFKLYSTYFTRLNLINKSCSYSISSRSTSTQLNQANLVFSKSVPQSFTLSFTPLIPLPLTRNHNHKP